MFRYIICLLLFVGPAPQHLAAEPPVLDAERIELEHCVLILDRDLLDHREAIAGLLDRKIGEILAYEPPDPELIRANTQRIYDVAAEVTGIELSEEKRDKSIEKSYQMLAQMNGPLLRVTPGVEIFLLKGATMKAYLRTGGSLPGVSYDPESDKARLQMSMQVKDFTTEPEIYERICLPPVLDQWNESYMSDLQKLFELWAYTMDFTGKPIVVGEHSAMAWSIYSPIVMGAVTSGILSKDNKWKTVDHTYWLFKGLLAYAGAETFRGCGQDDFAALYRRAMAGNVDKFPGHDRSVYLRTWSMTASSLYHEGSCLKEFDNFRGSLALLEIERLAEHAGPQKMKTLLPYLAEQDIKSAADLEAAIKKHTGYDIAERLDRYQAKPTPAETYPLAIALSQMYRDKKDKQMTLRWLCVALEAQLDPAVPMPPDLIPKFERALDELNDVSTSARVYQTLLNHALSERHDPDIERAFEFAGKLAIYAILCDKPELAEQAYAHPEALARPGTMSGNDRLYASAIDLCEAAMLLEDNKYDQALVLAEPFLAAEQPGDLVVGTETFYPAMVKYAEQVKANAAEANQAEQDAPADVPADAGNPAVPMP